MAADALLEGLDPAQRQAVTSDAAPLCILAGAGSGKTRVLTRRIAWQAAQGTADPRHVLALTFTRKAAGELGNRLATLGVREQVAAGTFHAIAYAQLRRLWADRGERPPALLERKARLLSGLLAGHRRAGIQPADVASEIEWAKARMVGPAHYEAEATAAGRKPPLPPAVIASLYERYEEEKRSRHLVDFDDLLLLCARAVETDEQFAAAQRWRFRHLFVDEFQDVNPVQFRLLDGWRGGRSDLCVVGDPNQAIFGWNGADARYLTEFGQRFPAAHVVRLDDNYRSSPQVLGVAGAVLAGIGPGLRANRPDGPPPTVRACPTDRDEARTVARALRGRRSPATPWSAMAVLARTNAQLVLFEEALTAAAVPFRVRGGGSFLTRPEVKEALAELAGRGPGRGLGPLVPDLEELSREGTPERRQRLAGLVRLAREHVSLDPAASVESFLSWLRATVGREAPDQGGDAVELATFHAAKGLEWQVVFLTGLERGLVPIGQADGPDARAEERRLLYVAVTRAQCELHCSWAERRTFGARTVGRSPSPWLISVEAAITAARSGTPGDWRRYLDEGRAKLRTAGGAKAGASAGAKAQLLADADPAVFEALKIWRATTARASGVPAYVIFHDSTLAAVARDKPRDLRSLLAVPGLGPVKADRYGDALLALVGQHA